MGGRLRERLGVRSEEMVNTRVTEIKENGCNRMLRRMDYAISTLKNMISNYRLFFKVCKLNGIVPEKGMNV